jgi:peptide-methionine (S)-S-oxide reductase
MGLSGAAPVQIGRDGLESLVKDSASNGLPAGRTQEEKRMTTEIATFGAGCFWGVEAGFSRVPGVIEAVSGYSGGHTENPTYKDVCTDETGHAEVVQVTFDPATVSFERLLEVFWGMHDPTQVNRQGPDFGSQYRTAIFFHTPEQEATAKKVKAELNASGKFKKPIATEITAAETFYRAEEYHQKYLEKRGATSCHF